MESAGNSFSPTLTKEVQHGSRLRCFGSIHPYPEYGGGIRLIVKQVVLIRIVKLRPFDVHARIPR
jgi:hypothetical protein